MSTVANRNVRPPVLGACGTCPYSAAPGMRPGALGSLCATCPCATAPGPGMGFLTVDDNTGFPRVNFPKLNLPNLGALDWKLILILAAVAYFLYREFFSGSARDERRGRKLAAAKTRYQRTVAKLRS